MLPHVRQAARGYRINHEAVAKLEQQAREIDARPPPTSKQRASDKNLYFTALALILVTPPGVWYWYEHRKEHMGKKKEALLKQMEERRNRWAAENK